MKKEWKEMTWEDCPNCGDTLLVFSEVPKGKDPEGNDSDGCWVSDGEDVKCVSCLFVSCVNADEDYVKVQDGNLDELDNDLL